MQPVSERLEKALKLIDEANAADPNMDEFEGKPQPKELIYGRRMSHWLERVQPDADEALQIAARAQHIERWTSPRNAYPEGRAGYLKWRTDLYKYHARRAVEIMREAGFGEAEMEQTRTFVEKRGIKSNPGTQALEDTACLVFLEHYISDFARTQDEAKMIDIVAKTWKKMSPHAQELALTIPMREEDRRIVERALASL